MESHNTNTGFPARYVFGIWGFLGFMMVYTMRANLNIVIVAMVNSSTNIMDDRTSNSLACPEFLLHFENGTSQLKGGNHGEFNWDRQTQSTILGAFFYGFVATQIPAGILVERWNGKWLFGCGVLITSILTLLSPLTARWSIQAFIVIRIIGGLAEGSMFPAINTMIGQWVPKMERSRLAAFVSSGMFVGNVISLPLSGILSKSNFFGGWPSTFYVFGAFGCLWFVLWIFLIYERPEEHPRISSAELIYITENRGKEIASNIPWKSIFTSVEVWALTIAYFGQMWGFFTLMMEMPTYLSNILHFSIEQIGMLSSFPYILETITAWTASYLADKMRQNGRFRITTIRKLFNSLGFFGSGLCILLIAFVGCRPTMSIVLICLALGFTGIGYAGFAVTQVDMSPRFSGILTGITNCFGNFSGFLVPYITGTITGKGETLRNWSAVFGITAGVLFITGIIYDIFCSSDLQPWNTPTKELETKGNSITPVHSIGKKWQQSI